MKIVYMGTPDFAVPVLKSLLQSEHQVAAVVTQPDKPKGRGKAMQFPPVKECAVTAGIPVYQPVRIKGNAEFFAQLQEIAPDCIVVAAFGQILPQEVLDLPRYGCVNVHASLLPSYRGAAPIQWSILNGEEKTGVTTMQMNAGLDTGDMLLKVEVELAPDETGESLHDKLAALGGPLLLETLAGLEAGTITPEKQNDSLSSYASMLRKDMGKIDWQKSAVEIERLIRGLNAWPSAYTRLAERTLKIWAAEVLAQESGQQPGTIVEAENGRWVIQTGDGQLLLKEVQLEGKKRMAVDAFLRGYTVETGTLLQ